MPLLRAMSNIKYEEYNLTVPCSKNYLKVHMLIFVSIPVAYLFHVKLTLLPLSPSSPGKPGAPGEPMLPRRPIIPAGPVGP